MTVGTIKMTARQYLQLGEDPPGVRLELVDGEVAVSPSPEPGHSYVDRRLSLILGEHIERNDLGALFGDVDTIFGPHDVRRPDILYFSKARLHLVGRRAMEGMPDLCVEILSPGSEKYDRSEKFELYRSGGVAHYWIVDPKGRTIEAYELQDGAYVLVGRGKQEEVVRLRPFAELEIALGRLWWTPSA